MSEANIITGQYVQISQSPASLGERIIAQIIDAFLIVCYLIGSTLLISEINLSFLSNGFVWMIGIYLPAFFYSFLMELFNHGQSVGKMVMRIRVVKKDGTTPGIGEFFMRWLLQLVDLGFSGIGALIILISKNSQRLGDLAAGTMVIRLNDYRKIQVSLDEFYYLDRKYKPVYPQAEDLSINQLDVIQRTLNTEYGYERERRIASLAAKVREHLKISDTNTADEKFLYTIVRDYQHYSLEII
ncbi:RDD family protein [Prevotella sp. F0091]|uniref:RDD family protein n=1 Tax=Prevotella sp. F0091 TaxID=1227276 RepID=UPI0025E1D9F3|nr:RDD family protein [Prevotella sp. F0091]